jgi:hypothetical protein
MPTINGAQPGVFFFVTDGARSSPPACAIYSTRWAIDGGGAGGQQTIATILAAQAMGRSVTVVGTGSCGVWADTESVAHITVLF